MRPGTGVFKAKALIGSHLGRVPYDLSTIRLTLIELTLIGLSWPPDEKTLPMLLVAWPLTCVAELFAAGWVIIDSLAMKHVVVETSLILELLSILKYHNNLSWAMLHPEVKVSCVGGTIWPLFSSKAVLLIRNPISFIDGTRVRMIIRALAMWLVVEPLPRINITRVTMNHQPESCGVISVPLTDKYWAILPDLGAFPISQSLTGILCWGLRYFCALQRLSALTVPRPIIARATWQLDSLIKVKIFE